jgi:hypothetical protein
MKKNPNICLFPESTDYSTKIKKCFFFSYKISYNLLEIYFGQKLKSKKKLDIYIRDWLKFWKNMVWTLFKGKKRVFVAKKSEKLGSFGHKKSATVLRGQFLKHLNWCPLRFFDVFLASRHQTMLILQEILFGNLYCSFGTQFSKIIKNCFYLSFGLCWEACGFFMQNLYLSLVRQLFREGWVNSSNIKGNL